MGNKQLPSKAELDRVKLVLDQFDASMRPSKLMSDAALVLREYDDASPAEKKKLNDKVSKKLEQVSAIYSLDNHYLSAETLDKDKYRTLMMEIANQLTAEYDCKTTTEKMLVETAAVAFCHSLEYGLKLSNILRMDNTSHEKNNYYAMVSKEVDRSTRQYITALNTLKRIKQPPVQVVFKSTNAFVANNQQINATDNRKKPKEQNNVGQ
jgi:hypothetical protein